MASVPVEVNLTREVVDNGVHGEWSACPVFLALKPAIPCLSGASYTAGLARVILYFTHECPAFENRYRTDGDHGAYYTSVDNQDLAHWMDAFDDDHYFQCPVQFTLEVPQEVLACATA